MPQTGVIEDYPGVDEVVGTVVGRWYVTVLLVVFLWRASAHLGWRRTGVYAAVALTVGIAFENGSVAVGFPYTGYTFNEDLRGDELFVGDVPLMVPVSYMSMGYLAFAAGRLVASGPWRTRARRRWHEHLLGVVLMVWAVWILDPVSRLGHRFFLGRLFEYDGPGFWFGLPVGSQLGFTLTAVLLVGTLTWLARDEPDRVVESWTRHPHLVALTAYHGQVAMMATVAIVLDATELGGSAVLMWVPAALLTAVLWSNLRPAPADAPAPLDAATHAPEPSLAAQRG